MAGLYNFPSQKISDYEKEKNDNAWGKKCVDSAEGTMYHRYSVLRKSYQNKVINYNLYSDILDPEDVKKTCNPFNFSNTSTPAKMQNYPIMNPKVDLLLGEEISRNFNWKVSVINDNAVSDKEGKLMEMLHGVLNDLILKEDLTEEEAQAKLQEHQKYISYTWQDVRELRGDQILRHLWYKQDMKSKFDAAFKDVLIVGEEIGQWDIVASEPVFTKLNPKQVHVVRSGESPFVEDADIIVVDGYYSPGQIIDQYHDVLTDKQVKIIDSYFSSGESEYGEGGLDLGGQPDLAISSNHLRNADDSINTAILENGIESFTSPFDVYGNIKVIKVYWKSMRKMKRVKYFDDFGDQQEELLPDSYKIDKDKGEESKVEWISEWWEGHKILSSNNSQAEGIYVKVQPRPVQFRSMENQSKCHPGIIGTIYNTNDNKAVSMVDRMKPYQYMYNILYYNTELLLAANWGKIMKVPLHEIPEGWEVEKWLYFARNMKAVPYNAFKEGKKGAAQGKLAGQMAQNSPVIDMEQGNTIQMYISMMSHIKQELGEISGVSAQRLGQIQQRESVGNVESSLTSSSHITEHWFEMHSNWKKRVLQYGLETAKIAWGEKGNKKIHYVMDGMTMQMTNVDTDDFLEIDHDIAITNSRDEAQVHESLKGVAQAAIQNDKMNLATYMDILTSTSTSAIRRTIEDSERSSAQAAQEQAGQAERMQQEMIQAQAAEKQAELDNSLQVQELKNQGAVTLESLKQQATEFGRQHDLDSDGIPDEVELEKVRATERTSVAKMAHETSENEKDRAHETVENDKDRTVQKTQKA